MNMPDKSHWHVDAGLASKYSHPLDTQLYHDKPLLETLGSLNGKRVLDIGSGNGYYARLLAQRGAQVVGIDSSTEMVKEAQKQSKGRSNIQYYHGYAEQIPFPVSSFDAALSTFTINTFPHEEMVEGFFRETSRILKPQGSLAISLPNPATLDKKTNFRWTEWQEGQSMATVKPGDAITRKIKQANGEILTVTNYYWPTELLRAIALKNGLVVKTEVEAKASQEDIDSYPDQLEPIQSTVPFFYIGSFQKA